MLCAALSEILDMTYNAFEKNDIDTAYKVEPLEQVIDELKESLRDRHISRLKEGESTVEVGFIWSDLLTDFERTSDHCSNIAVCIIDAACHNMNAHESMRNIKSDNEYFAEKVKEYSERYSIK